MTQKIAISKAGINVLTNTTPDNFIYSSDYDTLKYEITGTINLEINQANFYLHSAGIPPIIPETWYHLKRGTVAHGLGYTPYFVGYLVDFVGANTRIQSPFYYGDAGFVEGDSVYADATNLHFFTNFNSTSNSGIVSTIFTYRIFKNDLGL